MPLTPEQDAVVRDLLAQVPTLETANLPDTIHSPLRKLVLAELGRRDPSLAYRAAAHLWARDLGRLAGLPAAVTDPWVQADEWACFATSVNDDLLSRAMLGRRNLLVLDGDRLLVFRKDAAGVVPGLAIEPMATLGICVTRRLWLSYARGRPATLPSWKPCVLTPVSCKKSTRALERVQCRGLDVDRAGHGGPAVSAGGRARQQPRAVSGPVPR